jgi:Clr5 domain
MATTQRISPAEWDIHKETISTVYLTDNKTLDEVIQHMEDTHGFSAT